MWLTPGRASGRKKNVAPKLFMMAQLEHGHCTARSTVLSGDEGQTAVGLDPINEGVQPDVLQQGRAGMARQRHDEISPPVPFYLAASKVIIVFTTLRRQVN